MDSITSRRNFLKGLGVSFTLGYAGTCGAMSMHSLFGKEKKRPNIIFLLTDDQAFDTLSVEGNNYINTPNLDRLAEEGVRFSQAYVPNPVCMPSRVSFLTGLYERVHGVGFPSSQCALTNEQWSYTYPAMLRQDGYWTGFVGKFGIESYEFRGKANDKFDSWYAHDGWATFFPKTKPYPQHPCDVYKDSKSNIVTDIMGDGIDRFLESAPKDKPFCLSVSFSTPHASTTTTMAGSIEGPEFGTPGFSCPANEAPELKGHPIYGDLYRDQNIELPEEIATDPYRFIPKDVLDQKERRAYTYAYDKKLCIEHNYRYYQCITGVDRVIGQMTEKLNQKGLADNTIIIFSSDHGLQMGHHAMGGKALLYDQIVRVPFIIFDPRTPKSQRGKVIDSFVLQQDLAPTILDYACIKSPSFMQGRSLVELMKKPKLPWREDIFLDSCFTMRLNPLIQAVRTKDFKYVRFFRPEKHEGVMNNEVMVFDYSGQCPDYEQLFDLSKDPEEKTNLINDPKYFDVSKKLRNRCIEMSDEQVEQRKKYISSLDTPTVRRSEMKKINPLSW